MGTDVIQGLWQKLITYFHSFNVQELAEDVLLALLVILLARLLVFVVRKFLEILLKTRQDSKEPFHIDAKLGQTLRVLLGTLSAYAIYFAAVLTILYIFHVRIFEAQDFRVFGTRLVQALVIFAVAKFLLGVAAFAVEYFFLKAKAGEPLLEKKRAMTLSALLQSVLRYVIYFIAGIMILQTFGVQTSSILASAGIVGLAVGFGAQNLVRDIISGFFIIFEDQFSVGEYVTVADVTGVVEELGLRSTTIREWTGHLYTIPNGEIGKVKNFDRGPILALVTVGIAYEDDIDKAAAVLRETGEKVYHERDDILEAPNVLGVESLSDSSVDLLVTASTKPGRQWAVQRELRRRFKQDLEAAGIEIPFPRRVVYHREQE